MTITIAAVQFQITHQQSAINFARIEAFIQRAVAGKADIIVFPEDCVTGSIFGDLSKLERDNVYLLTFQALARQYTIDIVAGSFMRATDQGNFNTSYYIDHTGAVLATYNKHHLYHSERSFLTPGTEIPVFDTRFGKAGIVICWDIMFPEMFRAMMQQGVQVIYCPSYWSDEIATPAGLALNPHSEQQLIDAIVAARAIETNCAFVYVNAAGLMQNPDGSPDTLTGQTQITLPFLGSVAKLAHNKEALIIHTLDLDILKTSDAAYKLRADV